eukprot:Sdes_comp20862_c0_seq2m17713
MAMMASTLKRIGEALSKPTEVYESMEKKLKNITLLKQQHWSDELKYFADYGNNTYSVALRKSKSGSLKRVLLKSSGNSTDHLPRPGYLAHFGYVSLFPLLMKVRIDCEIASFLEILPDSQNDITTRFWNPTPRTCHCISILSQTKNYCGQNMAFALWRPPARCT